MYACTSGATTMPYTLEQDLADAAKAGIRGIKIWSRKLGTYLESHSVDDLKTLSISSSEDSRTLSVLVDWMFRQLVIDHRYSKYR